jgi:YggT family protein
MLTQALTFVIDTLAGFLTVLLLLRFYMQAFRVSFANQIGAFVVQLTNWLVKPLRRVLPGIFGFDLASLLPAYLLQVLLLLAVLALRGAFALIAPETLVVMVVWQALLATVRISLYLLVAVLFLQAILSWVNPYSPLSQPLAQLTRPFLDPLRRFVPAIAGIDLAPLVAILLAQLVLIFV